MNRLCYMHHFLVFVVQNIHMETEFPLLVQVEMLRLSSRNPPESHVMIVHSGCQAQGHIQLITRTGQDMELLKNALQKYTLWNNM